MPYSFHYPNILKHLCLGHLLWQNTKWHAHAFQLDSAGGSQDWPPHKTKRLRVLGGNYVALELSPRSVWARGAGALELYNNFNGI
jgi:hypothetical protein